MLFTCVVITNLRKDLIFSLHLPTRVRVSSYTPVVSATASEPHHRQISDGGFRAALFGLLDGLVTNVSLILGFAGANPGHDVVRLAGLAGLVAGAFSMGHGG